MIEIIVFNDVNQVDLIRAEWDLLTARSKRTALGRPYVVAAWDSRFANDSRFKLVLIVAQDDQQIVALWPLYLDQDTRTLTHLGCGNNEEYAGILWDKPSEELARRMLACARKQGGILEVHGLAESDPLTVVLRRCRIAHSWQNISPIIGLRNCATVDAWRQTKSKSFRQMLRNARSRLNRVGLVQTGLVTDMDQFVDWYMRTKTAWVDRKQLRADWMRDEASRFLQAVLRDPDSGVVAYEMTCNDQIVAGAVLILGLEVEYFLVSVEPQYEAYSPGHLLLDAIVEYAASRGQNVDMRLTQNAYKLRWANSDEKRLNFIVASSLRGTLRVMRLRARHEEMRARNVLGPLKKRALAKLKRAA